MATAIKFGLAKDKTYMGLSSDWLMHARFLKKGELPKKENIHYAKQVVVLDTMLRTTERDYLSGLCDGFGSDQKLSKFMRDFRALANVASKRGLSAGEAMQFDRQSSLLAQFACVNDVWRQRDPYIELARIFVPGNP